MEHFITDKYFKAGLIKYTRCRHSPPAFRMNGSAILISILSIGFLILFVGGESAYSQCAGLCLYDANAHPTKIAAEGVEAAYGNPNTANRGVLGPTGGDQAQLLPEPHRNSGITSSKRTRVSQVLPDKFVTNVMHSTDRNDENSDTSVYASNDTDADSSALTPNSKDWEFVLIPYAWLTSISEDIVVNGRGTDTHATFIDLLKHLDIAAMIYGEVLWKRKLGFFADSVFAKLAINKDVTLRHSGSLRAGLQTSLFIQEFGGLYRVGTWPVGSPYNEFVQKSKPSFTFDILAGGRYWHLKNKLDIRGPLGILSAQIDQSQNWFDFIVGGRGRLEFYKKLFLELRTDIGGFDLSFSSKFSWNVLAVVGYELPWYRITPLIGYRALYDNYANGSGNSRFDSKMWMYGPALGVAFKF